ncbi:MAG: LptF/LptG family permease [Bacteroidota bacterium]|nr:LptF/LptG family permease [Bacteroidota bacterium]MDE2955992.1 LptF/LptG family permease [Bacteroidota bacterium]
MKLIHQLLLRRLPGPFLAWLTTLLFLLVMQFLIKFLPDLAGRGLPLGTVLELIVYNLAYMVVLAVPMATLLSALMAFGDLAEGRTWVVIKNSGIPLWRVVWPVLAVTGLVTWGMVYFNNVMLPESNFRARNVWMDIRSKRPGFDIQPGIFYEGLSDYSIMVRQRDENALRDVLIYDYSEAGRSVATIRAARGELIPEVRSVSLLLWEGEIHQLKTTRHQAERYERVAFERFHLRLDLSEFAFERSDPTSGNRSDRSTPTSVMRRTLDSLEIVLASTKSEIMAAVPSIEGAPADSVESAGALSGMPNGIQPERLALANLDRRQQARVFDFAQESARSARSAAGTLQRKIQRNQAWISRYAVEVHKKYSIAVACLVFMFFGAPLGLSIRRGGLGVAGIMAMAAFMFYWVTLVQGEKLADRGMLSPWVGMWMANIVMALIGLGLFLYVAFDLRVIPRHQWVLWKR